EPVVGSGSGHSDILVKEVMEFSFRVMEPGADGADGYSDDERDVGVAHVVPISKEQYLALRWRQRANREIDGFCIRPDVFRRRGDLRPVLVGVEQLALA